MTHSGSPPAELVLSIELVTQLLAAQAPALATRPVRSLAQGWDNHSFRVGEDHIARLPRRALAAALMRNEQHALPLLAPRLPVPVPAPSVMGEPHGDYPWPWSVVPWIEGQPAAIEPLSREGSLELATFWARLHSIPADLLGDALAPNPVRGCALADREAAFNERAELLAQAGEPLSEALTSIWRRGLAAPRATANVILQGDPHARNILTHDGHLAAVIDWGDVTIGDAAGDLGSLWMLVHDDHDRAEALTLYQQEASHGDVLPERFGSLVSRARAWALHYGVILRQTGLADEPLHADMGRQTLANLAA